MNQYRAKVELLFNSPSTQTLKDDVKQALDELDLMRIWEDYGIENVEVEVKEIEQEDI